MANNIDLSEAIDDFQNAQYGKDVRAALVEVAEAVEDAIDNQVLVLDTTLTESGQAADAAAVGEKVGDLRSEIETNAFVITGNNSATFETGNYGTATTSPAVGDDVYYSPSSTGFARCAKLPCQEGDKIYLDVYSFGGKVRAWYFVDANMKLISCADNSAARLIKVLTAPANSAYLLTTNNLQNKPQGYYAFVGEPMVVKAADTQRTPYNLASGLKRYDDTGYVAYFFPVMMPPGKYALYINAASTNVGTDLYAKVLNRTTYNASGVVYSTRLKNGSPDCLYMNIDEPFMSLYIFSASTVSGSASYAVTITDALELYKAPYVKANVTYDVTRVIQGILAENKYCSLSYGDYHISNLEMANESELCGEGDANIYFDDSASGVAIMMGSRCTVRDLTLYGADQEIVLPPSDFEPERGDVDFLASISPIYEDGYVYYGFSSALPAGEYSLRTNISTSNIGVQPYVKVLSSATYSTGNVIETARITNGEETWVTIRNEVPIESIFVFAAGTVAQSAGFTVTVEDASEIYTLTQLIGTRHGIGWQSRNEEDDVEFGRISNCRIERFDGSGIRARDTGYPVDNNLEISDCFVRNCAVGVYVQRNSEFNKISNSTLAHNWYGILNRGGNNNICNCGIDANVVGILIDNAEGTNGGHGTITGCSINHSDSNNGYGLTISGTGRMLVSNCNFYYSKIKLNATNGNIISSCGFGSSAGWEIIGGACNIFSNCMIRSASDTPITITNNAQTKIVNCFDRAGNPVTAP